MYRLMRINLLILLLFSCLFITNVNALVDPKPEFYVNDYANVLSQETEDYIVEKSKELYRVDGTQIVVVTVSNLEGKSIEEYSLNLARSFGIGSKEKNNGLLLLLALEERESRVEVGTGLEGILPDGKTGRFQDQYMIPFFRNNDFDTGIKNGYDAFFNEIVKLNNLDLKTQDLKTLSPTRIDVSSILVLTFVFWYIGVLIGVVTNQKSEQNKGRKIYFAIWAIATAIIYYSAVIYMIVAIANLLGFMFGWFVAKAKFIATSGGASSSGSHYSSFSSSHSSFSSHSSGGGGDFSGGGSSRHF